MLDLFGWLLHSRFLGGRSFSSDINLLHKGASESVLRLGGPVILHFKFQHKSVTPKFMDATLAANWLAPTPQARQVVRGSGQGQLYGHFGQPALPEAPHASLLLQNSVYWFHDRFAFRVHPAASNLPRMRRCAGSLARVRNVPPRFNQRTKFESGT